MKMKKCINPFILALVLCIGLVLCLPQTAYGADYTAGQSLVAADQAKASRGLSFPGLDITWLDLGDEDIGPYSYSSSPGQYSEGIFTLDLGDATGSRTVSFDTSGRIVSVGAYDNVGRFSDGMALIKKQIPREQEWQPGQIPVPPFYQNGYIDLTGKEVIPLGSLTGINSDFHDGLAVIGDYDQKKGYIDKTGKTVIDFQFGTADERAYVDRSFYDGLAAAMDASGKYGYIDKRGNFVIPAKYLETEPFKGEAAIVTSANSVYPDGYGSSYLIDRQGVRLTLLWSYGFYSGEAMEGGLFRVCDSYTSTDPSFVMLNRYGAEVIPSDFKIKNLTPFNKGYALLIGSNKDGKPAVGLVKKPENIEEKKAGRLIKVFIDGKQLDFTDTDPVIENSKALVPMKAIFESLGAGVSWDAETYTVSGTKDGTTVSLKIGDSKGYINGEAVDLDVPARLQNSRTLVPVRFIAESLHAEVSWDDASRTVIINTGKQ